MRQIFFFVSFCVLFLFLGKAGVVYAVHDPNSYQTSGVYDEQKMSKNSVDQTAEGSSLSAERFKARVEEAYLHNSGGVIDGNILGYFAAFGANQNKILQFRSGDLGIGSLTGHTNEAIPLSGTGAFAITNFETQGAFGFNNVLNDSNITERVVEVGLTALSSSITSYPNVLVQAILDNGERISATTKTMTGASGQNDTFFGFTAPAGRYITDIDVDFETSNSMKRLWIDDIGFRTAEVANFRLEMTATVDGQASSQDGVNFTIQEMDESILSQNLTIADIYKFGLMEFSLTKFPKDVDIVNAMLELDVNGYTHSGDNPGFLSVYAYSGDGKLTSTDVFQTNQLVGRGTVNQLGLLAIMLDPASLESLLAQNANLGFVLVAENGQQVMWHSLESNYATLKPTLTLDYNIKGDVGDRGAGVPEPGTLAIAAFAVSGLMFFRRKKGMN